MKAKIQKKSKEFSCFEVLDGLFRGLKASPVNFSKFWSSNPWQLGKMQDPDPH